MRLSVLLNAKHKNLLISSLVGDRIWPVAAPTSSLRPYVVFRRIGGTAEDSHNETTTLEFLVFQYVCVADTYDEADRVREALKNALEGNSMRYRNPQDIFSERLDRFAVSCDFLVSHDETASSH